MSVATLPFPIKKSLKIEKFDEKDRTFTGWLSVDVVDKANEIVNIDHLEKEMDSWMARNAPISDQHSNRIVGEGLGWERSKKNGKDGIRIKGRIFGEAEGAYKTDTEVWESIKDGTYGGLSFGGAAYQKEFTITGDNSIARELKDLEAHEVAVVPEPCNPEATFEEVNMLAKSAPIIVKKPFADYKDFDHCVVSNKDKNDPKAYCASIMQQVEGKSGSSDTKKAIYKVVQLPNGMELMEVEFPDGSGQVILMSKSEDGGTLIKSSDSKNNQEEIIMVKENGKDKEEMMEEEKKPKSDEEEKKKTDEFSSLKAEIAELKKQLLSLTTKTVEPLEGELAATAGSEVKLPKSDGDKVQQDPKEGEKDKVILTEKIRKELLEELKKDLGIQKSSTPRPNFEAPEVTKGRQPALEMMTEIRKSNTSFKNPANPWTWRKIVSDRIMVNKKALALSMGV